MSDVDPGPAEVEAEARRAFAEHLRRKAEAARLRYGFYIDAEVIREVLDDRQVVRYPVTLHFDAAPLLPGEFAAAQPLGFHPSDGFCLFVHPWFANQPENLALLVAYHIPTINYGPVVEPQHAELFGATLVGLDVDTYYRALCELADSIPGAAAGPGTSRTRPDNGGRDHQSRCT